MTNMVESKLTDVATVCVSTIKSRILLQLKIKHTFDHVRKTKRNMKNWQSPEIKLRASGLRQCSNY